MGKVNTPHEKHLLHTAGAFLYPKRKEVDFITNQELNTQLYQKMFSEQERYRQHLLTLPPEEILEHAYAYTTREDILLSLEYNDLTDKQCQALLKSPCPLSDVFRAWEKCESAHMEELWSFVEDRANTVIQAAKAKSHREER